MQSHEYLYYYCGTKIYTMLCAKYSNFVLRLVRVGQSWRCANWCQVNSAEVRRPYKAVVGVFCNWSFQRFDRDRRYVSSAVALFHWSWCYHCPSGSPGSWHFLCSDKSLTAFLLRAAVAKCSTSGSSVGLFVMLMKCFWMVEHVVKHFCRCSVMLPFIWTRCHDRIPADAFIKGNM